MITVDNINCSHYLFLLYVHSSHHGLRHCDVRGKREVVVLVASCELPRSQHIACVTRMRDDCNEAENR